MKVICKTVDGFQGQECDIIIFLAVRSNNRKKLGFLLDFRRLNVAITRGRFSLLLIGNCQTLGTNDTWRGLINTAKENNCIQTCATSLLIKKVIDSHKQEDMKMMKLKNPTSELFENSLWSNKIVMMQMFKDKFPSITDKNKRDRIFSFLLRLAVGNWPEDYASPKEIDEYDFSKIVFLYRMESDILVWSVDLQVSYICMHVYIYLCMHICMRLYRHTCSSMNTLYIYLY